MRERVAIGPLQSDDDRAVVQELGVHFELHRCTSAAALHACMAQLQPSAILCDADAICLAEIADLINAAHNQRLRCDVILRCGLHGRSMLSVATLPFADGIRLSVRGYEALAKSLLDRNHSAAGQLVRAQVIRRLADVGDVSTQDILSAAVVIGERRTSVQRLAQVCGFAARTVEWRLGRSLHVSPSQVLAWSLCIHAVHRVGALQWTVKQTAVATGCVSAATLNAFFRRRMGCSPRLAARKWGVGEIIERYATWLHAAHARGARPNGALLMPDEETSTSGSIALNVT